MHLLVPFSCFAVDPSGDVIAAGSTESFDIYIFSVQTGQCVDVIGGHEGPVCGLAFNPVDSTLASVSWDKTARIWDIFQGKNRKEVFNHQSDVLACAFAPNGKLLATSELNGTITFWDVNEGVELFTIEGRRDCSGGRRVNDARTAKNSSYGKAFNNLCFSSDGTCILAGGNSKYMCMYDISQQLLVKKFTISSNRSLDGVLEYLNSANMTEAGPIDLLQYDNDSDSETEYSAIPGATRGDTGKRKAKPVIRCKSVQFSPSSKSFAAATTEGCMIYSLEDILGSTTTFDPLKLGIEVTPDAVKEACDNKEYILALTLSLRLNEKQIIRYVFNLIPASEIKMIVTNLPLFFLQPFLDFLASEFEVSLYIERCLQWWVSISFVYAEHLRSLGPQIIGTLRAIHKAIDKHNEDISKMSCNNVYSIDYLKNTAKINEMRKKALQNK